MRSSRAFALRPTRSSSTCTTARKRRKPKGPMGPGRDSNPNKGRTEYPKSGVSSFFHLKSGLFWPTLKAPTRVRGGDGTEQAIDRLGFSRVGDALGPRSERSEQV